MRAELITPSLCAQKQEESSLDIQARSQDYCPTGFLSEGTVIQARSAYFKSTVNACTTDLNKSEKSQDSAILMQYIDDLDQVMDTKSRKSRFFGWNRSKKARKRTFEITPYL